MIHYNTLFYASDSPPMLIPLSGQTQSTDQRDSERQIVVEEIRVRVIKEVLIKYIQLSEREDAASFLVAVILG